MTLQIFVCLLVMLFSREASCFDTHKGVVIAGNCHPDVRKLANERYTCAQVKCTNNGAGSKWEVYRCPIHCPSGIYKRWEVGQMTKTFPDCCPIIVCG